MSTETETVPQDKVETVLASVPSVTATVENDKAHNEPMEIKEGSMKRSASKTTAEKSPEKKIVIEGEGAQPAEAPATEGSSGSTTETAEAPAADPAKEEAAAE